jgi:hypothetical protein
VRKHRHVSHSVAKHQRLQRSHRLAAR